MWPILLLIITALVLGVYLKVFYDRSRALQQKLRQARQQRKEVMDFLGLFTTSLSTSTDLERSMDLVAHYLCDVLEAESLCIFRMVDEGGEKKLAACAVAGMFPPLQRTSNMVMAKASYLREHLKHERISLGDGIIGRVAELQRSLLIDDANQLPAAEKLPRDIRTLMAVPMYFETRLAGVIAAVNTKDQNRLFGSYDLKTMENISLQAALAINLSSIYSERTRQERILQELEFARQIQGSLLPETVPQFGEYHVHAFSRSALEVGGDFYDFIEMDENRLMVLIADASGKGVPACMLMAMCQSFARAEAERYTMMEDFLRHLNRHLYRDSDRSHFVTLAVLIIDKENHVCEFARAGHTELLVRMDSGVTRIIKPKGAALGLLPEEFSGGFDTLAFSFPPGSSMMVFTDGITEALNSRQEEFGLDRLFQIWSAQDLPPEEMGNTILQEVKAFTGDEPQADDQTIILLARPRDAEPEPVPTPAVPEPEAAAEATANATPAGG